MLQKDKILFTFCSNQKIKFTNEFSICRNGWKHSLLNLAWKRNYSISSVINVLFLLQFEIHTHYHNSNLILRTVSRRENEIIPSDYPRRVASRVIQWYGLIHKMWYCTPDQVTITIICLLYAFFLTFFLILKPVLVFNPEKLRERLP